MADYPVTPLTPPLSEQEIIRRQKLQKLIDAGENPYEITRYDVTHRSAEILTSFDSLEGKEVIIVEDIIDTGKTLHYLIPLLEHREPASIKLCALLSDAFEVTVKVAEIFECRTVRSIEALINDKMGEEGISYELRESYPLTQTQMH